ncbi:MAG: SRPBCC family protein [Saprospiraceae bacterium]
MMIKYTVKPMLGIPLTWVTEITHVEPLEYFVDEQRVGPYAIWHHQHFFKKIDGGIEMTDIVDYKLPLGPIGDIFHPILVKSRLEHILITDLKNWRSSLVKCDFDWFSHFVAPLVSKWETPILQLG